MQFEWLCVALMMIFCIFSVDSLLCNPDVSLATCSVVVWYCIVVLPYFYYWYCLLWYCPIFTTGTVLFWHCPILLYY